MATLTASVPGKVILMGEHSAVYGRPAVVAAIGLRLSATLRELEVGDPVTLVLSDFSTEVETTWPEIQAYARELRSHWQTYAKAPSRESFLLLRRDDPAHMVKIALGEGLSMLEPIRGMPSRGIRLEIRSDLPVGSGFGSSAAVAAAILAVLGAWQGQEISPEALGPAALEADRRQHGSPSGVDTMTVLEGGILFAERRKEGLVTTPLQARPAILQRFSIFDTGPPTEPTGSVVAQVRSLKQEAPHRVDAILEQMEEATLDLRRSLVDPEAEEGLVQSMKTFQRCLEDLGVVPREIQATVRQVEAVGGGAKISGAGSVTGPGAGSLLVYHPDPGPDPRWPFLSDFRRFRVPLGDSGVRVEAAASDSFDAH